MTDVRVFNLDMKDGRTLGDTHFSTDNAKEISDTSSSRIRAGTREWNNPINN